MMKYIYVISLCGMLAGCAIGTNSSADSCYGLGNAQCVKDGHRTDTVMRPEMTVYELNQRKKSK